MPGKKFRLIAVWSVVCCVGAMLRGQVTPDVVNTDAGSRDSKDTPTGVTVPDSPGAMEKLDKAREKEQQKQWKIAAQFYQEALSQYGARVVPVKVVKESQVFQYTGLGSIIQERLARWPAEGLTVYRTLYGHTADDLLAAAGRFDIATLRAVFTDYFVTDAGKAAGIRLMDLASESGDDRQAVEVGNRLLSLHPSLGADYGMIVYRTAVADHACGMESAAHVLLEQLKSKAGNEVGSIAGKDQPIVEALSRALDEPVVTPTTQPADANYWPSFNGINGCGGYSSSIAKPGANLTSIPLARPDAAVAIGAPRKQWDNAEHNALVNFESLGIMPALDGGSLFFQDGRCLYAVDADTGVPLPGWSNTYGGDRGGHFKISVFGRATGETFTTTVTANHVLAVMGQPDHIGSTAPAGANGFAIQMNMGVGSSGTIKLVCLDKQTGRECWAKSPTELPESVGSLRFCDYVGTPQVVAANQSLAPVNGSAPAGDTVLVVARGGKEAQFDDCYLVALSLKTGQYLWSCYVGSATRIFTGESFASAEASQLAVADGRVFIMTNLGSVAAVDPALGRVLWLSGYERENVENLAMAGWGGRRGMSDGFTASTAKAWGHNPVCVNDGHVFVLPNDSRQLIVLNEFTGQVEKTLNTAAMNNMNILIGVRDEMVVMNSDHKLFVLDWRSPDSRKSWREEGFAGDDNPIVGRGFMTADSIFIPTKERLWQISWGKHRLVRSYPATDVFSNGEGPGNVLVSEQNIIVAGQTQIDVYTDLQMVQDRYNQEIAASPGDPEPRLRFAQVLYSGGQTEASLARVDEAISLAGGLNSMHSGRDRAMIFSTLLDFARRTQQGAAHDTPERKAARLAFGNQLFDRAAAAAESPFDKANYRLVRARCDHENHDYSGEVQLCQEILSDPAMRAVAISENATAGDQAQTAIGSAIDMDRSVYRPIEARAAAAAQKAIADNDPQEMLAVAELYPNSNAAGDARQAAVNRLESANDFEQAVAVQRQMYQTLTDPLDKSRRLVHIVNDLLAMHQYGPAVDRLARAARLSPDSRMTLRLDLPDGSSLQNVPFAQAIEKLRGLLAAEQSSKLADFHLGPPPGGDPNKPFFPKPEVIEGITAVAHPLRDHNRVDQFFAHSEKGLMMFAAGQTTPMAVFADFKQPPLGCAWHQDHWAVWNAASVYCISGDGKLAWTLPLTNLPTLLVSTAGDPVMDDQSQNDTDVNGPGNLRVIRNQVVFVNGQVVQGQGQFVIRQGRMVRVVGPPAGVPAAPVQAPGVLEQIDAVVPAGNELIVSTNIGRVMAVNAANGSITWQTRAIDRSIDQLLANPHFVLARMDDPGGSEIVVYETLTGRVFGRRKFTAEGTPGQLVNCALSEDATLAFTLYNQVMVKDLYEAWATPPSLLSARNQDNAPFVGLTQSDQLIVAGGRLVCLYDSGHFARAFDLMGTFERTPPLATATTSASVWLQLIGDHLFILRTTGMAHYNLSDLTDNFQDRDNAQSFSGDVIPHIRTMFVGKDNVILLDEKMDRAGVGSPAVGIQAFSRMIPPGRTQESGRLMYNVAVKANEGITDWLGVDGGLYYLTKDGKLKFLHGARQ